MPSLERRNKGIEAEISVGIEEFSIAAGAIEKGKVQPGSVFKVASIDLGGCVEGVRMSFVRAMSRGASITPAKPAAETATASEANGEGEDSISRPPAYESDGFAVKESPGSGSAMNAEKNDRTKEVMVDRRIEWMKVLLVPFHIPQGPSAAQ